MSHSRRPSWFSRAWWTAFTLWHGRREHTIAYWPEARLRALQDRRARRLAAHAFATVPFYRDAMLESGVRPSDIQTTVDLARLPLVHAAQYAAEPDRFRSARFAEGEVFPYQTSGSSGFVRTIRWDRRALFLVRAAGQRARLLNARFAGRVIGGRAVSLAGAASPPGQLRAFLDNSSLFPKWLAPPAQFVPVDTDFEEIVARINALAPDVIGGYGATVGSVFRRAHETGRQLHRPRLVQIGGEPISEADRELIEGAFGIPVVESYGAAEAMRLADQCEHRGGYHVNIDLVAIRVVDADGRDVGPGGTGDLVISNLVNRATVLLNYSLGDTVRLAELPCPCGRTFPLIDAIVGRSTDLLVHPRGHVVSGLGTVGPLRAVPGVVQIQLIQETPSRFRVNAVTRQGVEWSQTEAALVMALRSRFGDEIEVTAHRATHIEPGPSGKAPVVIRRCTLAGDDGIG